MRIGQHNIGPLSCQRQPCRWPVPKGNGNNTSASLCMLSRRYKICIYHSSLPSITLSDQEKRWCQQVGRAAVAAP